MKSFLLQSSFLTDNLQTLFTSMFAVLPRLFGAVVFVILGFIIARFAAKLVKTAIVKFGIDKLGEKLLDIELVSKSNIDFKISTILSKIIYYFMLLIFIVAATDIVGMPAISNLFNDILNWIPNLLVALVILVLGLLFAELIRKAVHTACDSLGIPSARLISMLAFYFLFINIAISALAQAQIDTSFISSNISILIGAAALAFAIGYGLAAKNVVANFLASYYTKDKFNVGDQIRIDGVEGVISDMDRSTITLVSDGKKILIPLNKIASEKVEILRQG